jgi:hypothetical protein
MSEEFLQTFNSNDEAPVTHHHTINSVVYRAN